MQLKFMRDHHGFTLVEILISMTISLMVLAAAVTLLTISAEFGSKQLQRNYLQGKLLSMALTIYNEVTRAGFCFNCTHSNPYQLNDNENYFSSVLIDDSATKSNGSCIRFAYNHNKREKPDAIDKDDAKGFRLGKNPDGKAVIEVYENWNGLTNWHCNSATGYSGYWQDMMSDDLVLEDFSFSRQTSIAEENRIQFLQLNIAASIKKNSEIKENITLHINLPNVDE